VTRDPEYFRRRAAEARAAAHSKEQSPDAEIAGDLALAYSALARRHDAVHDAVVERSAIPLEAED
jgi:hypothetical protein